MGKVRAEGEIDEEIWKQLTDFIDQRKSSRKRSKKFYIEQIAKMAFHFMEERRDELEELSERYERIQEKSSKPIE